MRNTIFLFLTALAACFTSLQAHEDVSISTKIYVEASSIYINNTGIFLVVENELVPVDGIGRDESGLYVRSPEMAWGEWECYKCHYINSVADRTCYKCKRGRE